jgi:hypothetical protein
LPVSVERELISNFNRLLVSGRTCERLTTASGDDTYLQRVNVFKEAVVGASWALVASVDEGLQDSPQHLDFINRVGTFVSKGTEFDSLPPRS